MRNALAPPSLLPSSCVPNPFKNAASTVHVTALEQQPTLVLAHLPHVTDSHGTRTLHQTNLDGRGCFFDLLPRLQVPYSDSLPADTSHITAPLPVRARHRDEPRCTVYPAGFLPRPRNAAPCAVLTMPDMPNATLQPHRKRPRHPLFRTAFAASPRSSPSSSSPPSSPSPSPTPAPAHRTRPLWQSVVSGSAGGFACTLVGHPFETVKVRHDGSRHTGHPTRLTHTAAP